MAVAALCVVPLLLSMALAVPQNFYYESTYQPAYQPAYQVHQPLYNQHLLPIPYHGFAPAFVPAIPTHPIYSDTARLQQGYFYETQDIAGGHSQVIYVAGPNSQQLFQQNARTLHFALPVSVTPALNETKTTLETEKTQEPQQINFFRATVLPQSRAIIGAPPLFIYSVQTTANAPKINEAEGSKDMTTSTTAKPKETEEEDNAESIESSTLPSSSSVESDTASSTESHATSTSESNENAEKTETEEKTPEESESSTENGEKSDS